MTDEEMKALQSAETAVDNAAGSADAPAETPKAEEPKAKAKTTRAKAKKDTVKLDNELRNRATSATGYRAYYHQALKDKK